MSYREIWTQMSDDEVFAAAEQLDDYNEDSQQSILAEVRRRKSPEYAREAQQQNKPQKIDPGGSGVQIQDVVVRDIKMDFGSMVIFMVKWVLASIPAIIILVLISLTIGAVAGGLFAGLLN